MEIRPLALPDVLLLCPQRHCDDRGVFAEIYRKDALIAAGCDVTFVQDNEVTTNARGVLRGLHLQRAPFEQVKLIRVVAGAIYDVAVDLRTSSPSFGQWVGAELSAENGLQLLVPAGFAHGYLTLSEKAKVQYKVSAYYRPEAEAGVRWDDASLAIDWPLETASISVNPRDQAWPCLADFSAPLDQV